MNRLLHLLTIILLVISADAYSQNTYKAFKGGEKLKYVVSYKILMEADVADVNLTVKNDTYNGRPVFHVNGVGKMYSFYRWFFDVRDEYNTYIDTVTNKPLHFWNNIKEGNYTFRSSYNYDWTNKKVHTTYRSKNKAEKHKTLNLTNNSFDMLSLFYNIRGISTENMPVGYKGIIEIVYKDTIRNVEYKMLKRETKKVPGVGKFKTIKYSCQLADSEGEAYPDGDEFFVWFTDDKNHIPVYIESPIKVGSVKVKLASYSGLRYPMESLTK